MRKNKVKVFITIDVEHSGMQYFRIGEKSTIPTISMDCPVEGKSYGLSYILKILEKNDLASTFFVEPFCSYYFGPESLESTIHKIQSFKQDIQLHMHPAWLSFRDGRRWSDQMFNYTLEKQVELIRLGCDLLAKNGAEVKAFRAGNFGANNETYLALQKLNIPLASNYNSSYSPNDCRVLLPREQNDIFLQHGIVEIPLTNFQIRDLRSFLAYQNKPFQAACTRFEYAEKILNSAYNSGLSTVNILLHNFEFINRDERFWMDKPLKPMLKTMEHFEHLCAYLHKHNDRFECVSFGKVAQNLPALKLEIPEESAFFPKINRIYIPLQNAISLLGISVLPDSFHILNNTVQLCTDNASVAW